MKIQKAAIGAAAMVVQIIAFGSAGLLQQKHVARQDQVYSRELLLADSSGAPAPSGASLTGVPASSGASEGQNPNVQPPAQNDSNGTTGVTAPDGASNSGGNSNGAAPAN